MADAAQEKPVIDIQAPAKPKKSKAAIVQFQQPERDLALTPVFDLAKAQDRLAELQKFVKFYLVEGEDFGTIPGTPKPTLYKPGADKLCDIYGLSDTYRITNRTEDWTNNLFDYEVECTLKSKRDDHLVSSGMGSCNSFEGKYRWRETKRLCPKCSKPTIIKGKAEYTRGMEGFKDGGYVCWKKDGKSDGCGAKFRDDDVAITGQQCGRVENDDIPTLKNTILKMAKKRAKVDAVLSATRSSGLFTQDIEDWGVSPDEGGSREAAQGVAKEKLAQAGIVPALFYQLLTSGRYEITGSEQLKTDNRELLVPLWDKKVGALLATPEQLGKLISNFERAGVPFKELHA